MIVIQEVKEQKYSYRTGAMKGISVNKALDSIS